MLNSAEHESYPAHNVKMSTIVGILTFISMINTTSESLKARNFFICRYFSLLCTVELSIKMFYNLGTWLVYMCPAFKNHVKNEVLDQPASSGSG